MGSGHPATKARCPLQAVRSDRNLREVPPGLEQQGQGGVQIRTPPREIVLSVLQEEGLEHPWQPVRLSDGDTPRGAHQLLVAPIEPSVREPTGTFRNVVPDIAALPLTLVPQLDQDLHIRPVLLPDVVRERDRQPTHGGVGELLHEGGPVTRGVRSLTSLQPRDLLEQGDEVLVARDASVFHDGSLPRIPQLVQETFKDNTMFVHSLSIHTTVSCNPSS